MCDLIDLKSPEVKTVGPKLASPLLPAPVKSPNTEKTGATSSRTNSGLNFVKRNSLDNNPFDNLSQKTAEYVRNQDDPFEVVLEKALKYKDRNVVVTPKARSVQFKDDFTPKKTRYSDVLKMNKTLDDSLMDDRSGGQAAGSARSSPRPDDSIIGDLDNTNLLATGEDHERAKVGAKFGLKNGRLVPRLRVEPPVADLSILSQSAMNDSLTESSDSSEEFLLKSIVAQRISICIQRGENDANYLSVDAAPKSHKLRRSLSQGDRTSPRHFRQQRSQSIVDSLKAGMGDDGSSIGGCPSIFFEDSMNKAFLQSRLTNDASGISNLSDVSSIARPGSVSSGDNFSNCSSAFSNRTVDRAFIESSVGNSSGGKGADDGADGRPTMMSKPRSAGSLTADSSSRDISGKDDIADLVTKYSQLRVKSCEATRSEPRTARLPSIISGSGMVGGNVCEEPENKLIDVDVFVPATEPSPPLEQSRGSSVSTTSSDSVFLDSNTVGRSILSEAKSLAKTFEELAAKTSCSSGSSLSEDLLNSRPRWNFDVLPVSDDEAVVDNLIELPISPAKNISPKSQNSADTSKNGEKSSSDSEPKSEKSMLKELETEFVAPEKKVYASTLLMDLEKLVKSEGNPRAIELLENLEKALGVKSTSNVELLASCFTDRNDLTKSPKRSDSTVATENIRDDSNEKSCEDNADVETSESLKGLSLSEKSLHDNLDSQKPINKSDNKSMLMDEKNSDFSSENSSKPEMENSIDEVNDDSVEAIKQRNQIIEDQKIAVEILVGLGKLLAGEKKDPATVNLLKNLGTVLNLASSGSNVVSDDRMETSNVKERNREDTPVKKRLATPPRKLDSPFAFSRSSIGRRSLESTTKNKMAAERAMRRSISVTHTPTSTTPRFSNTPLSADKTKSHLKESKKRFYSDPTVANASIEKKRDFQAVNNRKSSKDVSLKSVGISELARQDKPSSTVADAVKSKLRKKADSDGSIRRGPMKALIPLGNMQRRGSIGKRISPLVGSVTPPKQGRETPSAFTVTTSTPFPVVHISCPKKSPKSKPIASSTPDAVGPKNLRRSAPMAPSPGKNGLSCDISPVTSKNDEDCGGNSLKDNSKSSKVSKIGTPSKSKSGSQLPKLSPMCGIKSSLNNSSRGQRRSEQLQSCLPRTLAPSKSPSIRVSEAASSPLNNSNKLGSKVKPLNLISKLRRRSASVAEKENYA